MSTTDLVFRLLALDEASKVFKEVAASADETAAATDEANESSGMFGAKGGTIMLAAAAGAAVLAAKAVDMAKNFQTGMETLVTGAGESQSKIAGLESGVLSLAVSTGTSTTALTDGLYHIESAGVHGTAALNDLKAAAQGAKVGNADLDTVAKTMVGTMNSYGNAIKSPVSMMNMLVATVGSGDMQMQDLASSLGNVTPVAASAHISFQQVAGAIATMTSQNMSAQQATQDLSNLITSLGNPTAVATKEMAALGLNSTTVASQLGTKGLTGTMSELSGAILAHMGPSGLVLQNAFKNSQVAAQDANTMISQMPASLAKLASAYLQGSVTSKQWRTDLQGLDPIQAHMMAQFATTADQTKQFNDKLAQGGPAAQTFNAAMAEMTGGTTGLKTSLMLTGNNAAVFEQNVKNIGAAGQKTTGDVNGWGTVTQTTSFKLQQAREVIETLGIRIGTFLLPVVNGLVGGFMDVSKWAMDSGTWLDHHRQVVEAVGIAIGVMLIPPLWGVAVAGAAAAASMVAAAAPFIAIGVAIAAVAYGVIQLIDHWATVKTYFSHAAHDVESFFENDLIHPVERFFTADIPGAWRSAVSAWDNDVVKPFETSVSEVDTGFDNDLVRPIEQFFTVDIPAAWRIGVGLFKAIFVTPLVDEIDFVKTAFSDAFNAIPGLVKAGFSVLVGIVKAPINGVIDIVDMLIGALDDVHISIPSWVPGVGGDSFGINIPKIPQLAGGGLVMPQLGGSLVNVAEAGVPEIVEPLPALQQIVAGAIGSAGAGGGSGGAGSSPQNPLYMQLDLRLDGKTIDLQLVKFQKQGGRLQSVAMAVG